MVVVTEVKACFGSLPFELIDQILSTVSSVEDLGNVIRTAKSIYRRFEGQRERLISSALQMELGPIYSDARFLDMFGYQNPDSDWDAWRRRVHEYAGVYRDILFPPGDGTARNLPLMTVERLAHLCSTLRMMRELLRLYTVAYQTSFAGHCSSEDAVLAPFSRNERLRILRAFYRRQILLNAWAPTNREYPGWQSEDIIAMCNTTENQGPSLGLFSCFEPWELQHIDHADRFVMQLCNQLCIAGHKSGGLDRSREYGPLVSQISRLTDCVRDQRTLVDAVMRKPLLLMTRSWGFPDRWEEPYNEATRRYSLICLEYAWQRHRLDILRDPVRDQNQRLVYDDPFDSNEGGQTADRKMIAFQGDDLGLPPFAWVDGLGGWYSNWFGNALLEAMPPRTDMNGDYRFTEVSKEKALRAWREIGFTFWDKTRVEALRSLAPFSVFRKKWVRKSMRKDIAKLLPAV